MTLLKQFIKLEWMCKGIMSIPLKSKVKVKYVNLYSASPRSASCALPLPVSRRWSSQANPTARHSANTARPLIWVGVSRNMPIYFPSLRQVLIQPGLAQA